MRYFIYSLDGQRFGPADLPTLNQWAREGRLVPHMVVEPESGGMRTQLSMVPGIVLAPQPIAAPPVFEQYPQPNTNPASDPDLKLALTLGMMGIFLCAAFSIAGLKYANRALARGVPGAAKARALNITGIVLTLVGMTLFLLLYGGMLRIVSSELGMLA